MLKEKASDKALENGRPLTGSALATSFRPGELEVHEDGSGNLLGSRCRSCGAHFFPVRDACAGCLSRDLETVGLSTEGTLYTYSIVRQSTPDFDVPYTLAYVDFPEGLRIMGQVTASDTDEIRIGMPMVLVLEPFGEDAEGNPLVGYRFKPAPTQQAGPKND